MFELSASSYLTLAILAALAAWWWMKRRLPAPEHPRDEPAPWPDAADAVTLEEVYRLLRQVDTKVTALQARAAADTPPLREQILARLAAGDASRDIAEALGIAHGEVELVADTHVCRPEVVTPGAGMSRAHIAPRTE